MTLFKVTVKAIWRDIEVEIDNEELKMVGMLNRDTIIEELATESDNLDMNLAEFSIVDVEEVKP